MKKFWNKELYLCTLTKNNGEQIHVDAGTVGDFVLTMAGVVLVMFVLVFLVSILVPTSKITKEDTCGVLYPITHGESYRHRVINTESGSVTTFRNEYHKIVVTRSNGECSVDIFPRNISRR